MRRPLQRWVPRVVTSSGRKVLARCSAALSTDDVDSRKNLARRSICSTPGFEISPLAIFSKVRSGTPLPEETAGQDPLVDCNPRNTKSNMESGMAEHANPRSGVTQPGNGFRSRIAYPVMGRPRNQPRPVRTPKDVIGAILASNIRRLMAEVYRSQANETAQIAELARSSGIAKETIRRILARDVSPRIDNVQMLAIALGSTASDLLEPNRQGVDEIESQNQISGRAQAPHQRRAP
jgi:transcriptional regulator with XRE-family HTH domain